MIINFLLWIVVAAAVLMIVSRFNLGLKVSGFGAAAIAAIVIALVSGVVTWLLGLGLHDILVNNGGLWGAIVLLIVSAVVLLISGRILPGLEVKGFKGAIIAAIAIAVVGGIITWVLSLFNINVVV
jgi:putative membrane protein